MSYYLNDRARRRGGLSGALRSLIVIGSSAALAFLSVGPLTAEEPVDLEMINKIREEGFKRSQVMETVSYLTDVIGPRLSGSPQGKLSQEWTRDQLAEWGMENARLEGFEFGQGWSFSHASVHMVTPHETPLLALPRAWTPGTRKAVKGKVKKLKIESEEEMEKHKGELKGLILLLDDKAEPMDAEAEGPFKRHDHGRLEEMENYRIPGGDRWGSWRQRAAKRAEFRETLNKFLKDEGVVATVDVSSRGNGVIRTGGGGSYGDPERHRGVPSLTMAQEHYNWILRLLDRDQEVELKIDVKAKFHEDDLQSYNTVADIPGTHPEEVVLLGGHLDSWHPATGATDNAAACSVMMEAMRILKALDVKPRRTIRIALWSGEEQGLLGSKAYVKEHLADRPETTDEEALKLPERYRPTTWPIQTKPAHEHFSAYFNLDNGGGKIRGIYAQENVAVDPIFEAWLRPLHDLGATHVTTNRTGGTDHLSFDSVGLPGFQFIQDPMDYFPRTHHTNLDTLDHVVEEDLKQAAVVVATFAYHAAMRDERLPRKALPQKPPEDKNKGKKGEEENVPGSGLHDHEH